MNKVTRYILFSILIAPITLTHIGYANETQPSLLFKEVFLDKNYGVGTVEAVLGLRRVICATVPARIAFSRPLEQVETTHTGTAVRGVLAPAAIAVYRCHAYTTLSHRQSPCSEASI